MSENIPIQHKKLTLFTKKGDKVEIDIPSMINEFTEDMGLPKETLDRILEIVESNIIYRDVENIQQLLEDES